MTGEGRRAERGRFITIEGPEGSGKTTQAERLVDDLRSLGHEVILTREPGGTWLGDRLREILLARREAGEETDPVTDALLFDAARRHLIRQVIRPSLEGGAWVVCARFADSTLAYQGYGAGIPLATLRELEWAATDGLRPDLTILLDVPVETGLARKAPDDVTRFEADFDVAFHRRVRDGFLRLAAAEPERWVIVDASRDVEAVTADIIAAVRNGDAARTGDPAVPPARPPD